jgi:hypothetical protein
MAAWLVERRLSQVAVRLKSLRDELAMIDEQLDHLATDADDQAIRALVSETRAPRSTPTTPASTPMRWRVIVITSSRRSPSSSNARTSCSTSSPPAADRQQLTAAAESAVTPF